MGFEFCYTGMFLRTAMDLSHPFPKVSFSDAMSWLQLQSIVSEGILDITNIVAVFIGHFSQFCSGAPPPLKDTRPVLRTVFEK